MSLWNNISEIWAKKCKYHYWKRAHFAYEHSSSISARDRGLSISARERGPSISARERNSSISARESFPSMGAREHRLSINARERGHMQTRERNTSISRT